MPVLEAGPRPDLQVKNPTTPREQSVVADNTHTLTEVPPVYMVDNVVYQWGTQDRAMRTSTDAGMFDDNPNIGETRRNLLEQGTLIVTSRQREETDKGRRKITRTIRSGTVFRKEGV